MYNETDFKTFADAVNSQFTKMSRGEMFVVNAGDLFAAYLAAFPAGSNPIFRERTEHDCSCCKQFIRNLGNVVAVKPDGSFVTVWDGGVGHPYDKVAAALREVVTSSPIVSVFRTTEDKFGTVHNIDLKTGQRWRHLHGEVNARHRSASPGKDMGDATAAVQVFRRGLDEITETAVTTVLDLIDSNNLYRGEEHGKAVRGFRKLWQDYPRTGTEHHKNVFAWANAMAGGARIRNTAIGTLLVDLSEGVEDEAAVRAFEAKTAPENYKRPKSIITQGMVDAAMKTVASLDLEPSLSRRYAAIADISVNNVLWVNNDAKSKMKGGVAGLLAGAVQQTKVDIKDPQVVTVDEFFGNILPKATSVEVLVENSQLGNFASLTTAVDSNARPLFKWDNHFAWSYDGDVADSSVKQRVKKAGGRTDAKMRVSLGWYNFDDLDLHCDVPGLGHVCYINTAGILDVDMNAGMGTSREPVENMAWNSPPTGTYVFWVHQFSRRENTNVGFEIELEFDGVTRTYKYDKDLKQGDKVNVFTLQVKNGELTDIALGQVSPGAEHATAKWGVSTHTLTSVETILQSPNYWDGRAVGNRHYFFILKDCRNPDGTRGIYNEFLRPELDTHRKVFEVLGAKTRCPPSDQQLSGVGFSSTKKDSVVAVVKGPKLSKAVKIQF